MAGVTILKAVIKYQTVNCKPVNIVSDRYKQLKTPVQLPVVY